MSIRKAKTAPKMFETDHNKLKAIVLNTMRRVSDIVGSSMGPGGKLSLLESDLPGIPNTLTKDGVSIFRSLGSSNAYEHLVIESARDVAQKTVTEAGDGTTTATVLAYHIVKNLFEFCEKNPKYSPQKATRRIAKVLKEVLLPYLEKQSIKINDKNQNLLEMVATISANGDKDLAKAVIQAFEEIGYGDSSHVTIRQLTGKPGYKVERIDGFPIPVGFEESQGKLHTAFINDQGNQRCYMEKPLFLLVDGQLNDLVSILPLVNSLGEKYVSEGNSDFKNLVIFAHGFSDNVVTQLAYNFSDPNTLNVLPMITPMAQFLNSQTHFLYDLAAFTGARVFGLKDQIQNATMGDLGGNMEHFEAYRFRSTVVGEPDPANVEVRASELQTQLENGESAAEKIHLQERIGKITNGIAKLTIFGGSSGELKEAHDRAEDAICAVRSAITSGALPGGGRMALNMALLVCELDENDPARVVLAPAFFELPRRILENAGYSSEEQEEIITKLLADETLVYDVENQVFGKARKLGLFDATKAVVESLSNAVSIASVLGTMGGIVAHPRDEIFERTEAKADADFGRAVDRPQDFINEANERP
jgi:chaperonin GroEL